MTLIDQTPTLRTTALQDVLFRIFEILASPLASTPSSPRSTRLWARSSTPATCTSRSGTRARGCTSSRTTLTKPILDYAPHPLRKSLTDYVRRTGRPLLCTEETFQALQEAGEIEPIGLPAPAWLGAPLQTPRGSIGAIVVQSYVDAAAYSACDVATLALVARTMAIAIERQWVMERANAEAEMRLGELRLSRDEALRASQEKSRFLANMSHELRTPLNAILGYADLLLEDLVDPSVVADLGAIRSSARHLRELIDGVLDLTQVESGRFDLAPTEFSLTSLLDAIVDQVTPLLRQGNNRLTRVGDAAVGVLYTDRRALFQVILNLMGNACKFSKNGNIALRSRTDGGWVRIEVSDTGIGIDPEILPTLFEPFTQVDASTTRPQGGSGLGLAIASRLAGRLGGDIEGASMPGRGLTFVLRIPARVPAPG